MQTVRVQKDFSAPVERVFGYLSEHENLEVLFPTKVQRLRDGTDGERNGVGSARKLSFYGALPFVETVTLVEPNERIEYRITKGTPLRNHLGVMKFSPTGAGGTHLDYTISFGAAVPGIDFVVAKALKRSVAAGLDKVADEL